MKVKYRIVEINGIEHIEILDIDDPRLRHIRGLRFSHSPNITHEEAIKRLIKRQLQALKPRITVKEEKELEVDEEELQI